MLVIVKKQWRNRESNCCKLEYFTVVLVCYLTVFVNQIFPEIFIITEGLMSAYASIVVWIYILNIYVAKMFSIFFLFKNNMFWLQKKKNNMFSKALVCIPWYLVTSENFQN